ncbi:TonB-dependent receptor [Halioxenophilus aromaticivorans]|uniref:TonB-dependent receptor n=1 Tax=Halioxenophilus aromaticivorans TaxID=1306992 RepID=A0AAV3U3R3_9ALTE
MQENRARSVCKLAVAVALAGSVGPVCAQTIEELVVTAEKRESSAQTTAISMKVVGDEELANAGVTELASITNIAPTVNVAQNNDNTLITIRGVSSRDYTETGDPAVAVNIDNFYFQDSLGLNAALFDVQRIEVLRGPQGTLYGRNATAGALNITTNKPGQELAGKVAVEFGDYGTRKGEGAVDVPLAQNLSLRLAGMIKQSDGYRDNGAGGHGDEDDSKGFRAHLAWDATDRFSALLTYELVDIGGVGAAPKGVLYEQVNSDGTLQLGDDLEWQLNREGERDIEQESLRVALNYDFDALSIIYSGGVRNQDYLRSNDQDGGTLLDYSWVQDGESTAQNHEVRFISDFDGMVNFQAGAFYFKNDGDKSNAYFRLYGLLPDNAPYDFYTFLYQTENESSAVFGQLSFQLTDDLEYEIGARYTKDKKAQTGMFDQGAGYLTDLDYAYDGSKVTWHTGVNWDVSDDLFLYAKIDRGYKAGGFKNDAEYNPEEITAYEVGSKSQFMDNTLQLNSSLYYYDYTDLQVLQTDPVSGVARTYNAGAATIYGAELEMLFLPTEYDSIDVSLAYVSAEYDEFCTVTAGSCPAESDFSGNKLPQAPEISAILGYSHDFPLASGMITARLQTRFQDESYFTFNNRKTEWQDAYTKTDVLLTYRSDELPISVTGYVRNLENEAILTMSEEAGYMGGYLVQYAAPRMYGLRMDYEF